MGIEQIDFDAKLKGRLILALKNAIVDQFDIGDWRELGHLIGQYDYITGHDRLLRSLNWGDDDYGGCVLQVLSHFAQIDKEALVSIIENKKIKPYLEQSASDVLSAIGFSDSRVSGIHPAISASNVVRIALADADSLLISNGATSAIDRLHTALHGYLLSVCSDAQIQCPDNAGITAIFKLVRTQHPRLQNLGAHESEIHRILTAFASVIDSVNTIRNHGSVAHPNEILVEEGEAELAVNAIRTLFNYLIRKID